MNLDQIVKLLALGFALRLLLGEAIHFFQDLEQFAADGGAFQPNRLLILPVDEVPRPPACDLFKGRALISQVNEIRRRNPKALFTRLLVLPEDLREPTRVFVRKRPENESIHGAEDGGVRTDAERQREHRHGGEAGVLQQLAESESQILHIFDFRFTIWSVVSGPWSVAGFRTPHFAFESWLRKMTKSE